MTTFAAVSAIAILAVTVPTLLTSWALGVPLGRVVRILLWDE